ncbi:MAG: hypothetical protein QOF86_482, partial [Baekduia sp.]|nr:hypothetical protein [Baekduia sp.]
GVRGLVRATRIRQRLDVAGAAPA